MYKLLFVCMGNICRSPSAEGFFNHHLDTHGAGLAVETDSAGTHSYHLGHSPDSRAIATAAEFGVDLTALQARKVRPQDFEHFDMIVAMDRANVSGLERVREAAGAGAAADIRLMMEFSPRFGSSVREVPDPYYGEMDGFSYMCELLDDATLGLLEHVRATAAHGNPGGQGD